MRTRLQHFRFTSISLLVCLGLMSLNVTAVHAAQTADEKQAVTEKVYNNIFLAMGLREEKPALLFDQERARSVAYLKRNKDGSKMLAVEEKAYDICMTFGDKGEAALALLIGHELGHFRFNHHWGKEFSSSFAINDLEKDMEEAGTKLAELKFYETQADQSGGIYCYLAGYDISGLAEPLFRKIYKEYNIPETMPKYPSLSQRVSIARQNDSIVQQLIRVFETGTYALMIGRYDEAAGCLGFVSNHGFRSREVYNNAGAAAILSAFEKAGKEKIKYAYPVEIDIESRVKHNTKGFSTEVETLLKKAKNYFKLATDLDPEYAAAYINLACAHAVSGELKEAGYFAGKGKELASKNALGEEMANALVISAIVLDLQGEKGKAKDLLKEAIDKTGSYLAESNLAIISGKSIEEMKWAKKLSRERLKEEESVSSASPAAEVIDEIADFTELMESLEPKEIKMENGICYYFEKGAGKIYNLVTADKHELFFHRTPPGYTDKSALGIGILSGKTELLKKYGFPDAVVTSRGETIMFYKEHKLLFMLQHDKVSAWVRYEIL